MKISKKCKATIYAAIDDPIMKLRIEMQKLKIGVDDLDSKLFQLNHDIWVGVHRALGIDDPA